MALPLLPSSLDAYEAAVDNVIDACDGDLRGALTALIVANEYLERDLQEALAFAAAPSIADDGDAGTPINWIEVRKLSRLATSKFEAGAPVKAGPVIGDENNPPLIATERLSPSDCSSCPPGCINDA